MTDHDFYLLVIKSLSKEISEDEQQALHSALLNPALKEKYDTIFDIWHAKGNFSTHSDFQLSHGKLLVRKKIEKVEPKFSFTSESSTTQKFSRVLIPWLQWAAILIFFMGIGYLYLNRSEVNKIEPQYTSTYKVMKTQKGQQAIVVLVDGSRVILNAESQITYSDFLSDSVRKVELQGEAYFEIAEDKSKPFLVQTPQITTMVLGTRFNVRAYQESSKSVVSLVEGSVEVMDNLGSSTQRDKVLLRPNQQVEFNNTSGFSAKKAFDTRAVIGWKDNVLYFDRSTLDDVLSTLKRRYGVEIK
ncbi:MAG: hypothetical protein HC819_24020 [Cyclobacteriaceae bacterium]|nr:hypothetical protein [Cyclobacteriaceae bacterium]